MIPHAIIEELVDLMESVPAMLTGTQMKIAQVPKYYILDHDTVACKVIIEKSRGGRFLWNRN